MAYWIVNGKQLTDKEYEEYQRQQLEEQEQIRQRAEALVQKLGQTYDELTGLMEQNPEVGRQVTERTAKDEEVYRRLKQRLELADAAPRCRWIKQDGTACGSPQMRKHIYCFAHKQMMETRALALRLPAMEDANAIQIGLMRVQKALIEDTISTKKAGLLLYSMQLALTNVAQTTFGQAKDEELVRDTVDEVEALGDGNAETDLEMANERILPKAEWDRSWEELPIAATQTDAISGSFGVPSTSLGISPAGSTPAERLNFGAASSRTGTRACSG